MKKILLILLFLAASRVTFAQQKLVLTAAASACTASNASCLVTGVDQTQGGTTFTISANASGNTIQFEASGDGGTTWVALSVTPSNSTTTVTSTTSTGTWQANIAGYTNIRMRMSTLVSGSTTVSAIQSTASARGGSGGGGGGATPGGVNPQLQYNNSGSFGGVAGSSVTSANGAVDLSNSSGSVTPLRVDAPSASQSVPGMIINVGGGRDCPANPFGQTDGLCIATGDLAGNLHLDASDVNDGPQLIFTNSGSVGNGLIEMLDNSLEIAGEGSDTNSAYFTMGDDFAPQSSNISVYSENWTYFGNNGNTTWYAAIGNSGHTNVGQIRAGWIPDKSGQIARTGFFSAVDAVGANEVDIQELGTIGTNWNFNLPANAGTAGQFLTSQGGTTASMTWTSGISSSGVLCSGTFTTVNGLVTACTAVSDSRLKTNIKPFSAGLAAILKLHPSLYHMNPAGQKITGQAAAFEQAGFIAQDVQKAIPEAIGKETHDGVDYLTVADRPILAALVNAVKEQQQEIAELKKQLATLKLTGGTR